MRYRLAMNLRRCLLAIACAAACANAVAAPIKRIDIYVTPYYEAAREPGGAPKVAVGKAYDTLLASSQPRGHRPRARRDRTATIRS